MVLNGFFHWSSVNSRGKKQSSGGDIDDEDQKNTIQTTTAAAKASRNNWIGRMQLMYPRSHRSFPSLSMPCAPGFVAKMAVAMDIDIDGIDVSTSWLEGCSDSQAILNKNSWYGPAGQPHFCWCRHVPVRGFRNRTRPPRNLHYLNLLRLVIRLFPLRGLNN